MRLVIVFVALLLPASVWAATSKITVGIKTVSEIKGMDSPTEEEIRQTRNCCRFHIYGIETKNHYCLTEEMKERIEKGACEVLR